MQAKEILFLVQVRVESVLVVRLCNLKEIWFVTRQDIVSPGLSSTSFFYIPFPAHLPLAGQKKIPTKRSRNKLIKSHYSCHYFKDILTKKRTP